MFDSEEPTEVSRVEAYQLAYMDLEVELSRGKNGGMGGGDKGKAWF